MIKSNKIKCLACGDVIESKYRHDFVDCSCGGCSVDGGKDYLRRLGDNYKELSEVTDEWLDRGDVREVGSS